METFYHGTNRSDEILASGFDIDAPRRCDPGDFGWGVYLTAKLGRAKFLGTVLQVEVDLTRFALVPNPYFLSKGEEVLPVTPEEKLFYECVFSKGGMRTINGRREERANHAKEVQRLFLSAGFLGICTKTYDNEAVVFSTDAILSVQLHTRKNHHGL